MVKKLRIGELSNLIGIPSSTLRYYEAHGILDPVKDIQNNYRQYSPAESCAMLMAKFYRSFDLPLEEVASMLKRGNALECMDSLERNEGRLQREIDRLSLLKSISASHRAALGRALRLLSAPELDTRPTVYMISTIYSGDIDKPAYDERIIRRWMRYAPLVRYMFFVSEASLLDPATMSSEWGFCMPEEAALALNERSDYPVERIPAAECLFAAFYRDDPGILEYDSLAGILGVVAERGLKVAGPAMGHFLTIEQSDNAPRYLYEVSIPIKK